MKTITKVKWIAVLLLITTNAVTLLAQTRADVFDEKVPVTWLGVDFSLVKFVGPHLTPSGAVTNDEFRDKYTVAWNDLIINEPKKFDIAKAINRPSVKNATDVTAKTNKKLTRDVFAEDAAAKPVNEAAISDLIKGYDFQGNEGVGMMFVVDLISKTQEVVGLWVTFVDMKTKNVLFTTYKLEKVGGFGFRNYYAKPFYTTLKDMGSDFSKWKKGK